MTTCGIDRSPMWLEARVRNLQFVQLISAIIALVTRMRDMNMELTRALANLRRIRPRSAERIGGAALTTVDGGENED